MTKRNALPDEFVSVLVFRSLVGQGIYGDRWPRIARRLRAHDRAVEKLVQAAKEQGQDGVPAAVAKWKKANT